MTRKKGTEEVAGQEGTGVPAQRGPKEKVNQVAAELERFAHTPNQTPKKSGHTGGAQHQAGHPGRRSQASAIEVGTDTSSDPAVNGVLEGVHCLNMELEARSGATVPAVEKEPSLKDILLAVNNCKVSITDLCEQLKGISDELRALKNEVQVVCTRTTALEGRLSQMEDDVYPLRQEVLLMKDQVNACMQKMDSMKNTLRRENLRVLGLPEGCEGNNPIKFMEDWLKEKFGKDSFSNFFSIERAHRIASRSPPLGGHPRPLIFKLLCFRDKVTILQKAREMKNIQHNSVRISIYPDFSPELQRQRARFAECKRKLQQLRINYALLYPARLRISALGDVTFFSNPTDVSDWLEKNEGRLQRGEEI